MQWFQGRLKSIFRRVIAIYLLYWLAYTGLHIGTRYLYPLKYGNLSEDLINSPVVGYELAWFATIIFFWSLISFFLLFWSVIFKKSDFWLFFGLTIPRGVLFRLIDMVWYVGSLTSVIIFMVAFNYDFTKSQISEYEKDFTFIRQEVNAARKIVKDKCYSLDGFSKFNCELAISNNNIDVSRLCDKISDINKDDYHEFIAFCGAFNELKFIEEKIDKSKRILGKMDAETDEKPRVKFLLFFTVLIALRFVKSFSEFIDEIKK
ncbi:hypothetical protein [Neptunomonas sp. XY-337]|uniref:hypothetical protein n=1 Tax=Neptunomonas sp. XY-337 TaxID=2561897 RepID=UPI0010A9D48C|nr:hypothetical protein [Neptunomonas sp. XY-337]